MADSYIFSGNDLTTTGVSMSSTSDDNYLAGNPYALIENELYIFGGETDGRKIAKLNGCSLVTLSTRLNNVYDSLSAAISINAGTEALICFDFGGKKCEVFDSKIVLEGYSTTVTHIMGGLADYMGQPTTVGAPYLDTPNDLNKVETLSSTGWTFLTDHPRGISGHILLGLQGGAMILAGGSDWSGDISLDVWRLKDNEWTIVGQTTKGCDICSSIKNGPIVYLFSGWGLNYYAGELPHHRIKIENDELVEAEIIGYHSFENDRPVLLATSSDYCV